MTENIFRVYFSIFFLVSGVTGCQSTGHKHDEHEEHENGHTQEIHLSEQKFRSLEMKLDTLPVRNMNNYVAVSGQLKVPPQNQASVTTAIGANIHSIYVREGEKVKKGQILASLSHPDLIRLQSDYNSSWNQLQFLEKEYRRQMKLREEQIGSGKEYERVTAEYRAMVGTVNGYRAQLKLLGLNPEKILEGSIAELVPLTAPIGGFIHSVTVRTGQYAGPETSLFEIINTDGIYADLMVFEKDADKVKTGQQVQFTLESRHGQTLEATIRSVGKTFEPDSKAIHIYAEIGTDQEHLIPGMYVKGRIITRDGSSPAIPEGGLVREGDRHYIFAAGKEEVEGELVWTFKPVEVIKGIQDNGWAEVKLLRQLEGGTLVAMNNAYYLLAELKKGETEHQH